jgi:ferredoxin
MFARQSAAAERPIWPTGRRTIGWTASRCLGTAERFRSCDACLRQCPADALTFLEEADGTRLAASEACHGCGQCVAACPTEALVNLELEHLSSELGRLANEQPRDPVELVCHRMESAKENTLEVRCLHGLPADQLLDWQAHYPSVQFRLTWPTDCGQCPARPTVSEASGVAGLEATLRECGAVHQWSNQAKPAHVSFDRFAAMLSRRRLFTALVGHKPPADPALHDLQPAPRRQQRLHAAAAKLYGLQVAARLAPVSTIKLDNERCEATGLCIRLCPSGALHEIEDGSLHFEGAKCLRCNICETHCPNQALRLEDLPAGEGRRDGTYLRSGKRATCFHCGHTFVVAEATSDGLDPVCHACRKDSALMTGQFRPGVSTQQTSSSNASK